MVIIFYFYFCIFVFLGNGAGAGNDTILLIVRQVWEVLANEKEARYPVMSPEVSKN